MSDTEFGSPENGFFNPFWFQHKEKILKIRKAIESPKTSVGESIFKENQTHNVFLIHARLPQIFQALITLIEYDEIFKMQKDDFFNDRVNQQATIKAFALLVEDMVKDPSYTNELKKYDDYLPFLNEFVSSLKRSEHFIEVGEKYPSIVNTLIMVFSSAVRKFPDVKNFDFNTDEIRKRIRDYLPDYFKMDTGRLLQAQIEMIKS